MAATALEAMAGRVLFSPGLPPEINGLLQAGVAASHSDPGRAERLFMAANSQDSRCLQTYFALYKFYFQQKRLPEAGRVALAGLAQASCQGGFPNDCERLVRAMPDWDLSASEAGLFYLYTLKALAFIRLRQGFEEEAQTILEHLRRLDGKDLSGASVIMDLAAGAAQAWA